jgi:hypothetical protein
MGTIRKVIAPSMSSGEAVSGTVHATRNASVWPVAPKNLANSRSRSRPRRAPRTVNPEVSTVARTIKPVVVTCTRPCCAVMVLVP